MCKSAQKDSESDLDSSPLCSFCSDSRSFRICLYCACQVCKSKHSQSTVLLCDGCDGEYHMGCLEPVLERVPRGGWWCDRCVESGRGKARKKKKEGEKKEETDQALAAAANAPPVRVSRSGRVVKPKVRDANEDYSEYRGITMADRFVGETKLGKFIGAQVPQVQTTINKQINKRGVGGGGGGGGGLQPNKKTRNVDFEYEDSESDDEGERLGVGGRGGQRFAILLLSM